MKNITTIIALLAWFSASSQHIQTLDSTWVNNTGGQFFEYRLIQYMSGEEYLTKKKLGDTSQVVSLYKEEFIRSTDTWATDIEWTSTFSKKVTELIRQDQALTTSLGRSPIKTILETHKWMVDSIFKTKEGNKTRAIKFSITNQGNLRYKIDTFATRNATLLGKAIRLSNYLNTGNSLDLYQFRDGRWRDGTRTVQIFLATAGPQYANREAPANFADVPVELPITYEGGLVHAYGQWLKYDGRKKKWLQAKPTAGIKPQSP